MSHEDLPSTLVEEYLNQREKDARTCSPDAAHAPTTSSAALPPGKQKSVDEVLAEMKRVPLFMNNLDDMDEDNEQLQALHAIAYEGTRAEIAANFKTQGNELVQVKKWLDAREFYTKALQALHGPVQPQPQPQDPAAGAKVIELDEHAEEATERALAEACHANRALCNLEMKNYGSCNRDCAAALRLNPLNVKAWYRAGAACLALDKLPEALDACANGLAADPASAALRSLRTRIHAREATQTTLARARAERLQRERDERATLQHALRGRGIVVRESRGGDGGGGGDAAPDLHDASMALEKPLDAASTLRLPVLLLYPLAAQSDLVKACGEDEALGAHLEYILPPPWDEEGAYAAVGEVECYVETAQGGLVKAGKNVSLLRVLAGGKVEVVDGLVKVNVVPRTQAAGWIEQFKLRRGKVV
nr:hsp70/hsp90 co-chaperone cns1 [Quercus suber]